MGHYLNPAETEEKLLRVVIEELLEKQETTLLERCVRTRVCVCVLKWVFKCGCLSVYVCVGWVVRERRRRSWEVRRTVRSRSPHTLKHLDTNIDTHTHLNTH